MRAIENEDYQQAIKSFQRSVDLDKKFALGFGGLGLANAKMGNNKEAKKYADKCASKGSKDPDALALSGRIWINMRDSEKRWFKRSENYLEKGLKRDKEHEGSQYWYGVALFFIITSLMMLKIILKVWLTSAVSIQDWLMENGFPKKSFAQCREHLLAESCAKERINRADLAVLFSEELKIGVLFDRMPAQTAGFQSPSQAAQNSAIAVPNDSRNHWAETWIKDMIRYGVMNVEPDGNFYPDDNINRATYAMAVQRLLVVATRDESWKQNAGESQSRFSDVPSSHFAYNAMAICTERGIMQVDMMNNRFNPTGDVTGLMLY